MQVQFAPQSVKNFAGSNPSPHAPTATHEQENRRENTGVPQSVPQNKKPSFSIEEEDLRLQVARALALIQEMSPDLSENDFFYFDQAIGALNRLVDEDLIECACRGA